MLDTLPVGIKVGGEGDFPPGHLSAPTIVGGGKPDLFENLAVMECAELPWAGKSALLYARDAIVDMVGPAAGYSPFSKTFNLVLRMTLKPGASDVEYDEVVRNAGIRASAVPRSAAEGCEARLDRVVRFTQPVDRSFPAWPIRHAVPDPGHVLEHLLYGKSEQPRARGVLAH